ncbi:MAG: amidophosphoribosyltransferase [Promethearchaeota archaeon]
MVSPPHCSGSCRSCRHACSLGVNDLYPAHPLPFDKPREACGVFGVSASDHGYQVSPTIYHGLMALQHRGQEAAGLAVTNGNRKIRVYKNNGLVAEALTIKLLDRAWGNVGIGHVRYGTAGSTDLKNAQPYVFKSNQTQFSLAFNGNIANYDQLKRQLQMKGRIFQTDSDTEVIAKIIASTSIGTEDWVENLKLMTKFLDGSYSLLFLSRDGDIYAIRDPLGFKPLCYGVISEFGDGNEINVVSSESCAIDSTGGRLLGDVRPGEILHLDQANEVHREAVVSSPTGRRALCQFEFVYFARPDSVIDGISVGKVRERLGRNLARTHPVDSDNAVVVPVPDSGRSAALGYALESGHPYAEGLMKNRYVWRTFIQPGQAKRLSMVRQKLNPIKYIVKGKEVILIDDSIVRGTTMSQIVKLLRDAGAKKVHVRSSCPEVREPCYMGVDFPTKQELIVGCAERAHPDDYIDLVCEQIGADSLGYQTIDGLVNAIGLSRSELCLACLNGDYPLRQAPEVLSLEETFSQNRA